MPGAKLSSHFYARKFQFPCMKFSISMHDSQKFPCMEMKFSCKKFSCHDFSCKKLFEIITYNESCHTAECSVSTAEFARPPPTASLGSQKSWAAWSICSRCSG